MVEEMKQIIDNCDKKLEEWDSGDRDRIIRLSETIDKMRNLMNDKSNDIDLWMKNMNDEAAKVQDKIDRKIAMKYIRIYRYLNYASHEEVVENADDPFHLESFLRDKYLQWHDERTQSIIPGSIFEANMIMENKRKRYTSTIPLKKGNLVCDN